LVSSVVFSIFLWNFLYIYYHSIISPRTIFSPRPPTREATTGAAKMLSTGVARKPEEEFGGKRRGQPEELERPVRLWTASGCGEVHWERTCGAHFLRSFARNFAVGAGVKTLLNVVGFLLRKRRKGKGVPKRPVSKLLKLVELRWGFFLGALAGVWKAVSCLSRRAIIAHAGADPCDLDQVSALQPRFAVADLLAGATTGLGLFFIRPEDRRTLALYSLVRSTEFLAAFLARRELLPTWLLRCFTQLDLLIMCATAGQGSLLSLSRALAHVPTALALLLLLVTHLLRASRSAVCLCV